MAKIGTLHYDINGNDNLRKILEEDKKRAVELQNVLKDTSSIMSKIDIRSLKAYSAAMSKAQIDAARLAEINRRSDDASIIRQQQLRTEIERTNAARRKSSELSNINNQRSNTESLRGQGVSERNVEESAIRQQKLRTEIERTNAAHQRYVNSASAAHRKLNSNIGITNKTMFSQKNILNQLSQAAGIYFSIYQVGSFIKSLYTVSGEFEKQRISLAAILQSTSEAGVLYERIKTLSVKSPFQFGDLVSFTKQLSAFSVPYNELYDTTKRLADVSAGLGVDMGRLVLAFGQVRSASVLRGQELRQFTEAGIPLVDELAKKFTKLTGEATSAGDVFDKISRRQVSFEMVKEIFTELTSEGGKFYKFQEIQAESLSGKISNLIDSYQIMLSEIGEGNSGVLKDSVDILTQMMNNWEDISKAIKALVVAYGSYKAALIIINSLEKANIAINSAQRALAILNMIRLSKGLTAATYSQVVAQKALNLVMSINPYVAIATVIGALIGTMVLLSEKTRTVNDVQNDFNKSVADQTQYLETLDSKSKELVKTATDLTLSYVKRKEALDELKKILPTVFKDMNLERLAALGLADAYNKISESIGGMAIGSARTDYYQSTKELIKIQNKISELKSKDPKSVSEKQSIRDRLSEENKLLANAEKQQSLTKKRYLDLLREDKIQEKIVKSTEKWREIVEDIRKETGASDITAMKDEGYSEYIKRIQGDYEELVSANKKLVESNPFAKKEIDANKKRIESYSKVLSAIGGVIPTKKETGGTKDPIYVRVKQQIDIIDKAKTSYEEYLKVVSSGEASRLVKEQTGIDFSKTSVEEQLKAVDTKGMLPKNAISTANRIAELTIKYNKSKTVDSLKEALDSALKYVSDNRDKYNLYNELFAITGDKDVSKMLSFGNVGESITTYLDFVKSEFNNILKKQGYNDLSFDKLIGMSDEGVSKTIGKNDQIKSMFDNINQMQREQTIETTKNMAQIVSEYQSTEEKIIAIKAKYSKLRKEAQESGLPQEFINKSIEAFDKKQSEEIDSIMETILQLTPFYRDLFGNLSDISYWHLKKMRDNAMQIVQDISTTKGDDGRLKYGQYDKDSGKLSGYTYEFEDESGNIQKATITLKEFAKIQSQINKTNLQIKSSNPFAELVKPLKDYSGDGGDGNFMDALGGKAEAFKSVVGDLGGSVSNLFSAFGNKEADDSVQLATELAGSAVNIAMGISTGNPIQVIQGIIGGITSIAKAHDERLQRAIEESRLEVVRLKGEYENLERFISRQLGGTLESQAKAQLSNLEKQRSELYKQMAAEEDKKKTDISAIEDYKSQIAEISDQISYFYEDLFGNEFGSNIKDWASQISDSLVNAFSNGEDAALAFDKTVSSIVKDLANSMIRMQFIEPAMKNIRDYLFGKNGVYNDANLSSSDLYGLIDQFNGLKGSISSAKDAYDIIAESAKQAGVDLSEGNKEIGGITADAQSLSEQTGNLLSSYINAVRADVSYIRSIYEGRSASVFTNLLSLLEAYCPNAINQISLNNAELSKISANTLRSANNSDSIYAAVDDLRSLVKQVTTSGSGRKLNI